MKVVLSLIVGLFFLSASSAEAKIKIPVGEKIYLHKVADLPDTEDYTLDPDDSNPEYVDLGIFYSQYVIAFIPIWTMQEPKLVLLNEANTEEYYSLTDEQLDAILLENNLDKSKLLSIGFFSKYGGKLIILALIALIIYGIIPSKKKEENEEEQKEV